MESKVVLPEPFSIAPYQAIVVPANYKDEEQMKAAEKLYKGSFAGAGSPFNRYEVSLFHMQVYASQNMVEAVVTIVKAFLYSY